MNIAQLHERVKNLSDGQLAEVSQGKDTTASLALMELNERNDIRESAQAQMMKPPTIAEQERAKSGIGMPPIDPRMIPQNILAGVGNPNMMPMPQPRDSGVSQLPAPVMMADGGLVRLANGGTPFSEQNFLQRLGGFANPFREDFGTDFRVGRDEYITKALDELDEGGLYELATGTGLDTLDRGAIATGIGGLGIKGLASVLKAAKKAGLSKKAMDQIRKLYTKPKEIKGDGFVLGKGTKTTTERIKGKRGTKTRTRKEDLRKERELDPGRAVISGYLGLKGIDALLGDDDSSKTPAKTDKPSSDAVFDKFKAGIDKLSEQQASSKKEPSSKKASTGGLADLAIQTGLRFAAGETLPKAILEGSEFIAGQKEKAADRKLKKDALALEKRGQDLVLQAAGLKAGLNQNQLANLKIKVEDKFGDQIDRDVALLVAEQEKGLPFFRTKVTNEQKKRLRKALLDQKVQEILLSNTGGLANIGGNQIDLNVLNRLIADKQS